MNKPSKTPRRASPVSEGFVRAYDVFATYDPLISGYPVRRDPALDGDRLRGDWASVMGDLAVVTGRAR